MRAFVEFLHRYVAPFLTGVCIAGATVVHDVPAIVALVAAAGVFGYFSFPVGGRVIMRLSGKTA